MSLDLIRVKQLKQKYNDKKIGFTCSCFDLLHCGHALMLKDASRHCDVLIVGLQSDPTIDRAEKNKPVQSFEEREIMLSAISYVNDIVHYSTENDLTQILTVLCPDVRILGTDWQNKEYTGHELPIEIYWHHRDHEWSTSYLRRRVSMAEREREREKQEGKDENRDEK